MPVDETRPLGQPVPVSCRRHAPADDAAGSDRDGRPASPNRCAERSLRRSRRRRDVGLHAHRPLRDGRQTWPTGSPQAENSDDPLFFSFAPEGEDAAGFGSYLRITPEAGSIEVGFLAFSPRLQRSVAATEAMYLMMKWAFEAGYRRYEWKCDALNAPSRRAAQRLGLSYEGVFRQATVVKGRNRDTAWFAAIDAEWPALEAAFQTWLAPENFDADGRQKTSLRELTRPDPGRDRSRAALDRHRKRRIRSLISERSATVSRGRAPPSIACAEHSSVLSSAVRAKPIRKRRR
jgi:RimJ/RimL family protein N-acetyltransferase